MHTKTRGEFMLMLTALIWGVSFVAQRAGMEYVGPFTFNGIRCVIGALALIPVIIYMNHSRRKKTLAKDGMQPCVNDKSIAKRYLILGGVSCGLIFFVSSSLQQIGMTYTTAGKAGFITSLYIVIVPLLGVFLRQKVRPILWVSVVLAITGLYLLCIQKGFSIGKGELLVMLCAFGFSFHILVIDYFSSKTDGVKLACFQFLFCGIFSVPCILLFESINWSNIMNCWIPILYAGVMSCGVAYTLQVVAQKYTEPTVTSLILSLESVFAVIAGIVIINEQISFREMTGCIIMSVAILLSQFPPQIPVVKGKIKSLRCALQEKQKTYFEQ